MRIRGSDTVPLVGIPRKGDQRHCVSLRNQVLRKMKFPDFQKRLGENALCVVCNYKFMIKTRGWADNIKVICHPFRDEEKFREISKIPKGTKTEYLCESDFIDKRWINVKKGSHEVKFDYVIFTLDTPQGIKCKGFYAVPLIANVAHELNMRGLIRDYYNTSGPQENISKDPVGSIGHDLRKTRKRLRRCRDEGLVQVRRGEGDQKRVCKEMKQSRCVIFPNYADASPKMISEALVRGAPIIVNKNIYGGWQYVTETNGLLYDGPTSRADMEKKRDYYADEMKRVLSEFNSKGYNPDDIKEEYYSKYGFYNSAKRLAGIINDIEGKRLYRYVFYKGFQYLLKRWKTGGK